MMFRKKPVIVEAWQVTPDDDELTRQMPPRWIVDALMKTGAGSIEALGSGVLVIKTLEGDMRAEPGDWIIRGVKGELYPCKPDIFEATYEPAVCRKDGRCQYAIDVGAEGMGHCPPGKCVMPEGGGR